MPRPCNDGNVVLAVISASFVIGVAAVAGSLLGELVGAHDLLQWQQDGAAPPRGREERSKVHTTVRLVHSTDTGGPIAGHASTDNTGGDFADKQNKQKEPSKRGMGV